MWGRQMIRTALAAMIATAMAASYASGASAHEVSNAGQYRIAIGWASEPPAGTVTWVDQPNAVQIFVDTQSGAPVSDLNRDCAHPDIQVTVAVGSSTSSPLCPVAQFDPDTGLGAKDEYDAALTPTAVGGYTFHLTGTIHGTKVDHTVSSGEGTFDSVGDQNSVEFPTAVPAPGEIATKADRAAARAESALAAAEAAQSRADSASALAVILGVIAIVVALLLGGGALLAARRRPPG